MLWYRCWSQTRVWISASLLVVNMVLHLSIASFALESYLGDNKIYLPKQWFKHALYRAWHLLSTEEWKLPDPEKQLNYSKRSCNEIIILCIKVLSLMRKWFLTTGKLATVCIQHNHIGFFSLWLIERYLNYSLAAHSLLQNLRSACTLQLIP